MVAHGYEEVDHTADIAIKVWAEDFYSLLIQAARGLYHSMGVVNHLENSINELIVLQEESLETILVDFLNELLYFIEDKLLLFDEFEFENRCNSLFVKMKGRKVHPPTLEIKAVTFHNLIVSSTDQGFNATITFDI